VPSGVTAVPTAAHRELGGSRPGKRRVSLPGYPTGAASEA